MHLQLTRRGDYAVRAMLALSESDVEPWLSATRISAAMTIPERFLPRVLRELARAGLIEARTGRTGGYRLARPANEITVMDVIAAVEPEDDDRRCVLRGLPCGADGRCAVHATFAEARTAMQGRLSATTLADLAHPAR
ncbi:MAG: Rrf2 family transcriptional regulator [Chloroflexota bacterium]|jgi:Rrf2 family iron-sulfur cluster assembly transcriptional regulator|nr:Rrf2 family transcriptional regulator [Chloroflexota bacterium]MDH5242552.1 Rrf2 family transcriptional regulator [Chloroflexota bacterium]